MRRENRVSTWPKNLNLLVKSCRFEDVSMNSIEEYILNPIGSNLRQATFLFVNPLGFTGYLMSSSFSWQLFVNQVLTTLFQAVFMKRSLINSINVREPFPIIT